jgi:NADPH:quinone reductase-like Zn-dependent oxidoreductase
VSATGTSVKSFPPNSQVLALSPSGTWTNQITTNSSLVFNVSSLTPEQAALVPEVASAWSILNQSVGQLPSGTTVIRTKDNSTVFNLAFDAIAKSKGYQVIVANESDFSNTKFQESVAAKGGASLILSSSAGRGNRHCFRLLNQNGTVVTYNGLKIPSLQETTGVEGPTTKLIFNNHRLSGFNFSSLLLNDHNSGKEAVEAAVQLLSKDNGAAKIENQIKKFSEDKVLEAILSSEAGDSVLLTIN